MDTLLIFEINELESPISTISNHLNFLDNSLRSPTLLEIIGKPEHNASIATTGETSSSEGINKQSIFS